MIDEILKYNKEFVANRGYEEFITNIASLIHWIDDKAGVSKYISTHLQHYFYQHFTLVNSPVCESMINPCT